MEEKENAEFSPGRCGGAALFFTAYFMPIPKVLFYNNEHSCCNNDAVADKEFVRLIKNGRLDIIKNLLYSPNYFYEVNAMEAMIYPASKNDLIIDENSKIKMKEIKEATYYLESLHGNVGRKWKGYKEMKMTDKEVIVKYQQAVSAYTCCSP